MAKGFGTGEALFSISQVNALTGVPRSTIRFWEKEFSEFLTPLRSAGGQRRYDRKTVEIIDKINRLVNAEGYTLEGARRKLQPVQERTEAKTQNSEPNAKMSDLATTMSDYLLQKLYERIRAEEARRVNPVR
ncbi:MAG: MerR family transcriptional regulator [Calditrichaeota bacterium]|nr:MerR family transcriptional regulator [Calditrichota bacterium]